MVEEYVRSTIYPKLHNS